jgi:hypothetical protein
MLSSVWVAAFIAKQRMALSKAVCAIPRVRRIPFDLRGHSRDGGVGFALVATECLPGILGRVFTFILA